MVDEKESHWLTTQPRIEKDPEPMAATERYGRVAEWLKVPAWKAGVQQCTVGSNPIPSSSS